jgi:hypothetical protein
MSSDLFIEMFKLSGKLNDLIDETKDKKEEEKLLALFFKVNDKCEKLAQKEFDENDDFYRDTIENIIDTERLIKDFKANQIKLINVFEHLTNIIANVERILLDWIIAGEK